MEHNYRISHRIGDSSFELESTDKDWVDKKEKEYLSKLVEQPAKRIKTSEKEPSFDEKKESLPSNITINEFYRKYLKLSKVTSRPSMAVFFIYYLSKISKKDPIKTQDVLDCFAAISYPNYNNLNMADILNKAKRTALLNNVNNQWSLTITGEDYVLNLITNPEK
ncbi:MAG: hypothetical protein FD146_125 [Anaerolineaceae bacterium]|nr:MAG: hypothetical protein FD146_125 [Anaerolineaceae bacterium]